MIRNLGNKINNFLAKLVKLALEDLLGSQILAAATQLRPQQHQAFKHLLSIELKSGLMQCIPQFVI